MKIFHSDSFYREFRDLLQLERKIDDISQEREAKEKLSPDEADSARRFIIAFLGEAERAELNRALERAERLKDFGEFRLDKVSLEEIRRGLEGLETAVYDDLSR